MECIEKIKKATVDKDVRVIRNITIGKAIHQGDVYLHRVKANHEKGKELGTRQVAVGDNVGSRHIVVGSVKVYEGKQLPPGVKEPSWVESADSILGPVVVADEAFTLTHPEHAHHQIPAGCYQVTYQADFSTKHRVRD